MRGSPIEGRRTQENLNKIHYQEALVTPGISPRVASSRKQILQRRKSRIKAPFRPHFQQRLITRVENLGLTKLLSAFAIKDFLAISLGGSKPQISYLV